MPAISLVERSAEFLEPSLHFESSLLGWVSFKMAGHSIVEYFGDSGGHRCGYCGSSSTNHSHGMWAHRMTCLDYQDLIDRGWRRSGKYVYKPTMKTTCCPAYTIKCDAVSFHPTKSQKKVLKKMTKFLTVPKSGSTSSADCEDAEKQVPVEFREVNEPPFIEPKPGMKPSEAVRIRDISTDKLGTKNKTGTGDLETKKGQIDSQAASSAGQSTCEPLKKTEPSKKKAPAHGLGPDPNKPPCRKAKILRLERKKQKLAMAKGAQLADSESSSQTSKAPITKSLEDFVIDRLPSQSPAHDLQVKIVRVDLKSEEFKATYKQTCALYAKYQMTVHKDRPDECDEMQFRRFLVDSPLEYVTGPGAPLMGFGSFHQQYFIDGKLVAVGVIDILPRCVSSVYLFYDPDYSFLSPGVYSALREIHFIRSLQRATSSIRNYYMGFYIHSCPKMRYKVNYAPSYLVCPETYNWIPIEQCRPKLDLSKYSRLDNLDEEAAQGSTDEVLVLFERQAMPYQLYAAVTEADDRQEVQEYAELVGPVVSSRMLLFRSG
ncbi:arginyl-tRNA--protein transferase 1-like isoform X1 [Oculina patagonica]